MNSDFYTQDKFIISDPNNLTQHTFTKRINLNNDQNSMNISVFNDLYQARLNKKLLK